MIKKSFFLLLAPCVLASCSFKPASGVAAQAMIDNGAFPGQAPAWVTQTKNIQTRYNESTFSGPMAGATGATSNNVFRRRFEEEKKQKQTVVTEEKSPLDKIIEACPSIEQELSKALITPNVSDRIQKYESLTRRCTISADLWVWLGNDYLAVNDYDKANTCALKAFSIDSRSKEASDLMEKAQKHGAKSAI